MKILTWTFIILALLSSCTSGTNKPSYNENIQHDDTLHGVVLENYIETRIPSYIFHTSVGIICTSENDGPAIQLLDTLDAHVIYSRIRTGKGPKELLTPYGEGYNFTNRIFTVSDHGKMQINNYRVSDTGLALVNKISYGNINVFSHKNISDTLIAVLTAMPDQSLMLMNENASIINQIPYQILDIEGLNYKRYHYPSVIDISRKHKIIIAADLHLPSIMAYSYIDNRLQLLWKKMIFEPDYIIKNNWRWLTDKNRGGFKDLAVTDQYIYVTYYTLLIFDLDGNQVRSVMLDHNITTFTVSPDDRVLYGVIERPDYLIVKFEL